MKRSHCEEESAIPVAVNPFNLPELLALILKGVIVRGVFATYQPLLCVSHRFYSLTSAMISQHFSTEKLFSREDMAIHFTGLALDLSIYSLSRKCSYRVLRRQTQLTALNLNGNQDIWSESLVRLTALRSLSLDRNSHVDFFPSIWMTRLQTLSLRENSDIVTTELMRATSLTKLRLRDTAWVSADGLTALQQLTALDISGDTRCRNRDLAVLTRLQRLDLSRNYEIHGTTLLGLSALTRLKLDRNNCISDAVLGQLTQVRRLSLKYNTLIEDSVLGQLTNLEALSLAMNEHISEAALSNLTSLTKLDLRCNLRIGGECLQRNLTALKRLRLSYDTGSLVSLSHLTHFDELRLTYYRDGYEDDDTGAYYQRLCDFINEAQHNAREFECASMDREGRVFYWKRHYR
jgi:Leucine-rich repeat (LRR) protein